MLVAVLPEAAPACKGNPTLVGATKAREATPLRVRYAHLGLRRAPAVSWALKVPLGQLWGGLCFGQKKSPLVHARSSHRPHVVDNIPQSLQTRCHATQQHDETLPSSIMAGEALLDTATRRDALRLQ